jgi:carbamoyl-phosphate synthase large subunit
VIYILEVNPRASRTVPFVAKTIGSPIAKIAARVMAGETIAEAGAQYGGINSVKNMKHIAVKEAVFPFAKFPGVDVLLGPEMRSTGEVMGLDRDFAMAFGKAQLGAGNDLPRDGVVYVSVRDEDKPKILEACRNLVESGFKILASDGTHEFLASHHVISARINKITQGRPHIEDAIRNRQVQLVINTTEGTKAISDSKPIRRAALMQKVPYFTTIKGAVAVADALVTLKKGNLDVHTLQSYFLN